MIGLLGLVGADICRGDPPVIQARQVASLGPTSRQVTEPAIAAGPHSAVTVFFSARGTSNADAWYAAYNKFTGIWASGEIDPNTTYGNIFDLSIAYDAQTGNYLAAATTAGQVVTCRFFEIGPDPGEVTPGSWQEPTQRGGEFVDKPWIVAGDPSLPTGQEYYITYWEPGENHYWYLRSVDGGQTWHSDEIKLADTGQPVNGNWCAQPAVEGDRPLYVAYRAGEHSIRFLVGQDVSGSSAVEFSQLLQQADDPNDPPVPLAVPLPRGMFNGCLPGGFEPQLVPQLAVDPSDPNRLYIVYHNTDTNDPNDTDVDVYLRVLTKNGDYWECTETPIQVNDPFATYYESDQFMPSVVVDDSGNIHIIYYDDQNYTDPDPNDPPGDQQPDTCAEPKFDVYYAWSDDQGETWLYQKCYGVPPEPALDWTRKHVDPKEYNGITWYGDLGVSEVWTAYTGTYSLDPQPNDAVIWSSLGE